MDRIRSFLGIYKTGAKRSTSGVFVSNNMYYGLFSRALIVTRDDYFATINKEHVDAEYEELKTYKV